MSAPVAVIGVPTALGGRLPGMERTPRGLRELGLLDRLRAATIRRLAAAISVAGVGATAITLANGDAPTTVDAVAAIAEAALG